MFYLIFLEIQNSSKINIKLVLFLYTTLAKNCFWTFDKFQIQPQEINLSRVVKIKYEKMLTFYDLSYSLNLNLTRYSKMSHYKLKAVIFRGCINLKLNIRTGSER